MIQNSSLPFLPFVNISVSFELLADDVDDAEDVICVTC